MAASSILRLSACFLLLLVFLSGFEAQTYPTTPYYLSTQQYPATTTQQPNSYNCGPSTFNYRIGNITSPNYPLSYENNQFCNYFIVSPVLSTINFTISLFNLEIGDNCYYDWIEFTCQTNSVSRTIRYCGATNKTNLSFKPCSRVLMRFFSDRSVVGQGFFVSYNITPISCQGNCTPVAIGSGYNCTCDANQTNPFIAPPYDQCPVGCHLSGTPPLPSTYCSCNMVLNITATTTNFPTPTVPSCPDSCYPYFDRFGYPVCYCNSTVSSTTPTVPSCPDGCYPSFDRFGYPACYCNTTVSSTALPPFECPYGCYLSQDSYGYPICHCEGTTTSAPCPYGCYNVTYYYGYSYCECSSPLSTTPLTPYCPSGCSPDTDYWGTPYCRCNSSYPPTTPYPQYTTSSPPCYSPCYYQYDIYGNPYCVCNANNATTTDIPCNYPCYYSYDNYNIRYCSCGATTTVEPCYYPCRYEYDYYGHQYCSCNLTTAATCNYPCFYGYDSNWYYTCLCNYSTTTAQPSTVQPGCDVTQTSSIGTLMSPNYPNGYPNNYNCVQSITVPMANSIQLTFLDINLFYSSSENCLYDWIEITGCDGSVKQHCSNDSVDVPIEFICTHSYTVTVLFHPYYYNFCYYRGFKLNYRSTFGSSCDSTGGLVSLGSRGNIVSPNYPDSYPLSNDCYYVLQAAERQAMRIRVAFELLMMQDFYGCSLEFIQLNCLDGSGSPWYVCGTRIPSPVTFNCSSVEIQFHSEIPAGAGRLPRLFKLVYYGVEGAAREPTTPVSSAFSLRSKLGSSGARGTGIVLLILFVTLAMRTSGWSYVFQ